MTAEFIQTVTIKLSNGTTGQFIGPVIVDEATPKDTEVVDVSFSTPRLAPYNVKILQGEDPMKPARAGLTKEAEARLVHSSSALVSKV